MEKKRNASFDLLKCICMVLIIAHHYVVHGGYDGLNIENFTKGRFFLQQVGMYGSLSCDVFALISGYYLIGENCDIQKRFSKFIRLSLEMLFYSVAIYVVMMIFGVVPFSLSSLVISFMPNLWGNWYIVAYLLFYLLVPFLNPMLKNLSRAQFRWLITVMLFCWSLIPTLTYLSPSWSWSNVDFFVVMYSIGAYFKLFIDTRESNKRKSFICGITSIFLLSGSICFFDYVGIKLGRSDILSNGTFFMPMYSVLAVFCAISWFSYFANINFASEVISYISGTVFGIYLIHENDYMRIVIWRMIKPNVDYVNNPYVHFMIKVVAIFVSCFIIEAVRKNTVARLDKYIENFAWNKIGRRVYMIFSCKK